MKSTGLAREALTATGVAAMVLLSHSAYAGKTVVSTIIGAYDASCTSTPTQ